MSEQGDQKSCLQQSSFFKMIQIEQDRTLNEDKCLTRSAGFIGRGRRRCPSGRRRSFKRPISTLIDVKFQFQPFEATSEDIFNKVIFSKPTEMGSIELQMTILKMEAPEALTADIVNHPQSFLNYE